MREKLPWVRRKLAEFEALGPPPEPRQVVAGELFPYLGREYPLELADRPAQPVTLCGDALEVDRALDGDARAAIIAWYEARAREYVDRAVARYVPLVGAAPPPPWSSATSASDAGASATTARSLGELPLAADHAAGRAGRLRRRARAGPPARAQPRSGVLGAGRGRVAGLQGAAQAPLRRDDQLAF